ncbi:MAG: hypothetical protein ACYDEC_17070 [Bacteroidia bacterium]
MGITKHMTCLTKHMTCLTKHMTCLTKQVTSLVRETMAKKLGRYYNREYFFVFVKNKYIWTLFVAINL